MQEIQTAKDVELVVTNTGNNHTVHITVDGKCIFRIFEVTGELICDDPVRGRDCIN